MDYLDLVLKALGVIGSVAGGAFGLAWWLGARLDKITTQVLKLELRLVQRLTRLEAKVLNGHHKAADEYIDD